MTDIILCNCSECGEEDLCFGFGASSIVLSGNSDMVYVCEICLEKAVMKIRGEL